MLPKVSILIPIYNMASYLPRCLDSLLAQSLTDIEIIGVNDGSTDASLGILESYASGDERIVVVNQRNSGVSAARNKGIELAKGEYIGFVDPDDWVDYEMYQVLYETAAAEEADVVMCTYMREFGTFSLVKAFDGQQLTVYRGEEVQSGITRRIVGPLGAEVANPEYLDAWGTVWSKLYRATLIKQNKASFVDLSIVGTNEDSLFNLQTLYHAQSFVFVNRPLYHYWRVNSSSLTAKYHPKLQHKFAKLYEFMKRFLENNHLPADYYTALNNRICLNIVGLGLNTVSKDNPSSVQAKITSLRRLLSEPNVVRCLGAFEWKHCPAAWKAFFLCAKWRLPAGLYIMLISMEWLRRKRR